MVYIPRAIFFIIYYSLYFLRDQGRTWARGVLSAPAPLGASLTTHTASLLPQISALPLHLPSAVRRLLRPRLFPAQTRFLLVLSLQPSSTYPLRLRLAFFSGQPAARRRGTARTLRTAAGHARPDAVRDTSDVLRASAAGRVADGSGRHVQGGGARGAV